MHGRLGTEGAVPGHMRGNGTSVWIKQEDRAAFGRHHVENHAKQLPFEGIGVAQGSDGGADPQQRAEMVCKS